MVRSPGSFLATLVGVGLDVADVGRIDRWGARYGARELAAVFTEAERDAASRSLRAGIHLAACFGAKEAVAKALGTGFAKLDWREVELAGDARSPRVALHGKAADLAAERGVVAWTLVAEAHESFVLVSAIAARDCAAQHRDAVSVIEVARVERALARWKDRWTERVLRSRERAHVAAHPRPAEAATARVAARVAASKILGSPRGIAVDAIPSGAPVLRLEEEAQMRARAAGLGGAHVSLSHAAGHAAALVVFETNSPPSRQ